jgi:selenocysteine-specific translation elongation factor
MVVVGLGVCQDQILLVEQVEVDMEQPEEVIQVLQLLQTQHLTRVVAEVEEEIQMDLEVVVDQVLSLSGIKCRI